MYAGEPGEGNVRCGEGRPNCRKCRKVVKSMARAQENSDKHGKAAECVAKHGNIELKHQKCGKAAVQGAGKW